MTTQASEAQTPAAAGAGEGQGLVALLFGLQGQVTRKQYLSAGVPLMLLKYAVEAGLVYLVHRVLWTPMVFGTPILSFKSSLLSTKGQASWLLWVIIAWSLPFMWIGLVMSVKRAKDAGISGWIGFLFLFPLLNYLCILMLSILPSKPPKEVESPQKQAEEEHHLRSALMGIAAGLVVSLSMVSLSVFVLKAYAGTLFLTTPMLASCLAAFYFNREAPQSVKATIGISALTLALSGAALLLFALEGLVCIMMAFPLAFLVCIPGALMGRALATSGRTQLSHMMILLLSMPFLAAAENTVVKAPLREVQTAITIDAPPTTVWKNVVSFSELPPPARFIFKMGIAYPVRARIKGKGVGAVRHCEFSTGPFVEPITHWEAPKRLSFKVTKNPPSMKEWSPYRHVYAPHLDDSFQSRRGEFRLKALPGGKTRLEGSTWYELKIFPSPYWTLWSDALITRIHRRVLEHIKRLSEAKKTP